MENGWYIEVIYLPNIDKKERRYFKNGFELNEDLIIELLSSNFA